jgi:CheY-like chemotaxis protein
MKTILLVDDDTPFRAIVSELLELAGYRVLGRRTASKPSG